MRVVAMVLCFIFLCIPSCVAEVLFGDLPLEGVSKQERDNTLSFVGSVTYLDSPDDLKYGEIYDVDIVDTTVLIAITYYNSTQVWILDVKGDFLYGYELPIHTEQRSYFLSTDGNNVLIHLGRASNILGLSVQDGKPVTTVYQTPTIVKNRNYVMPKRSSYSFSSWNKCEVIVSAPNGEQIIVVDYTDECMKYQSEKNTRMLPYAIMIMILFSFFLCTIAWLIKNNTNDPPSPLL